LRAKARGADPAATLRPGDARRKERKMRSAITAEEAASLVPDGATVMVGGCLGVGTPERVMDALVARGARGLTVIANDTARPGLGIGKLVDAGS